MREKGTVAGTPPALPADSASGVQLSIRRCVLETVVPLLEHAQRRYSDAVTDEGQARGGDPNKLGVIPGKQMSGREEQEELAR